MKLAALLIGAWCAGFMLPEWLRLLSTRDFTIPLPMNFASASAMVLLAYGIAA